MLAADVDPKPVVPIRTDRGPIPPEAVDHAGRSGRSAKRISGFGPRSAPATWLGGYRCARAGIVLVDLYLPGRLPVADLFASRDPETSKALIGVLAAVNSRFNRNTLRPGTVAAAAA